jgi:hypothetical protein
MWYGVNSQPSFDTWSKAELAGLQSAAERGGEEELDLEREMRVSLLSYFLSGACSTNILMPSECFAASSTLLFALVRELSVADIDSFFAGDVGRVVALSVAHDVDSGRHDCVNSCLALPTLLSCS